MQDTIKEQLSRIEQEHGVKILYACESGSRAWGFPGTDSDYDVRFIYAAPLQTYLSIRDRRDVIELPVNEVLDVSGWDIRKALQLFLKSNPPLYEWLQSPICYKADPDFVRDMENLMPIYFANRPGCHHYLNIALSTFENDLTGNEVKLKKYFYALRSILACLWIIENEILPPMEFRLLRTQVGDVTWQNAVDNLLEIKQHASEKTIVPVVPLLHAWLKETIAFCKEKAAQIPSSQESIEPLDQLFQKYIKIPAPI
ncbi:nucleotidyltransferase [Chitinophaga sp. SYP-B3965]|uniref:nucleotidyltransferase domain-containing protein n=1 Tax=Chitinophaga sp. SYP-B3965 TaxID=2663120 RepID=UPI00129961AC|nr:nucleotidyltransferase domain-containing protein [Chitinophaga sp. SYP-B3965]MRG48961.1 nucleotidyltransferase [Chitinophaga sp. SYP-B3965]